MRNTTLKEEKADVRASRNPTIIAQGDAFSDDLRSCMLGQWETAGILKPLPAELCTYRSWFWSDHYSRLCYALNAKRPTAQFISCYNTDALIAEFTAHIVPAGPAAPGATAGGRDNWREDTGAHKPKKQALATDFGAGQQTTDNPTWNNVNFFCGRGHLTPYGDFNTKDEKDLTMIVTNIAPQWQSFNSMNWAVVENAVKNWARTNTELYVFTGTAEKSEHTTWSKWWPAWFCPLYKLNKKVVIPKYYWKAVCEPISHESIVFVAENNVGEIDMHTTVRGCLNRRMRKARGRVDCYSLDAAAAKFPKFPLPKFDDTTCGTNARGTFLDADLIRNFS